MNRLIAILMMFSLASCTDEETSRRVLEDEGYTDIEIGGYAMFACSEDDNYRTSFTAVRVTPSGEHRVVTGAVCCGLWKNCTVRL